MCAAAAPHPSLQSGVGLQLEQIAATGTEKALLADVMEAHPDASYIELLRLFKARRPESAHAASCLLLLVTSALHCIVPAARCPRTSARSCCL